MKDMFVDKKYLVRHKILKCLNEQYVKNGRSGNFETCKLTSLEISKITSTHINDIIDYHEVLIDRNYIHCNNKTREHILMLLPAGRTAAIEETCLNEGKKIFHDKIFDKSKWLVPIVALIISCIALYFSLRDH